MEGGGHEQPSLAGLRRYQFLAEERVLVGITGLALEDQALRGNAERRQQARSGGGVLLTVEQYGTQPTGYDDLRIRIAPRQYRSFDETVAGLVQFIAAARQIDRALEPAAQHDDAVDCGRRLRTLEALLQRVQHQRTRRRPSGYCEDQASQGAARNRKPPPSDESSHKCCQQQDDGQVERLRDGPEEFGEVEEHASTSPNQELTTTSAAGRFPPSAR